MKDKSGKDTFTLWNAAVQQDGVSCSLHYISITVKGHLQITQVFPEGVGLNNGNLPPII